MLAHEATVLPPEVAEEIPSIVEDAQQSAFRSIATRLEMLGFPVSGDVSPDEAVSLDESFETYVRMMALNNNAIAALNDF